MEKQDMQRIIEILAKAEADRKADKEEMEADRKAWREEMASMRDRWMNDNHSETLAFQEMEARQGEKRRPHWTGNLRRQSNERSP
jgi:hypothetical protein